MTCAHEQMRYAQFVRSQFLDIPFTQNFRPMMCGNLVNLRANLGGSVVKNLPTKAGDAREVGSIPSLGRSPGVGNSNPLQYSCLGNPIHKEAWQATVDGVTKSKTQLSMTEDKMRANIVL